MDKFGAVEPWQRRGQSLWFLPVNVEGANVWVCLAPRYSAVVARAPTLRGLWIRMRPGTIVFGSDEIMGHSRFDNRFVVKTNDPDHARAWLCETACTAMANTFDHVFEANRKWVRATAYSASVREIPTAVQAIAALAKGADLGRRWSAAAQTLGARIGLQRDSHHPHGPMQINVNGFYVDLDTRVMTLGRREKRARLLTEVSAPRLNVGGSSFVVYNHANTRRGRRPAVRGLARAAHPGIEDARSYRWYGSLGAIWPRSAKLAFPHAKPLALVGDRRRITAYLAGFVDAPARLEAAARLCHALAVDVERNTAGPYR